MAPCAYIIFACGDFGSIVVRMWNDSPPMDPQHVWLDRRNVVRRVCARTSCTTCLLCCTLGTPDNRHTWTLRPCLRVCDFHMVDFHMVQARHGEAFIVSFIACLDVRGLSRGIIHPCFFFPPIQAALGVKPEIFEENKAHAAGITKPQQRTADDNVGRLRPRCMPFQCFAIPKVS